MANYTSNRRRHFRIPYPQSNPAKLKIDGRAYSILEVAEGGAKIRATGDIGNIARGCQGYFHLLCGEMHSAWLTLAREAPDIYAVSISPPIALPVIMTEQRFLIANYGKDYFR
jgi:hypothetical protein